MVEVIRSLREGTKTRKKKYEERDKPKGVCIAVTREHIVPCPLVMVLVLVQKGQRSLYLVTHNERGKIGANCHPHRQFIRSLLPWNLIASLSLSLQTSGVRAARPI